MRSPIHLLLVLPSASTKYMQCVRNDTRPAHQSPFIAHCLSHFQSVAILSSSSSPSSSSSHRFLRCRRHREQQFYFSLWNPAEVRQSVLLALWLANTNCFSLCSFAFWRLEITSQSNVVACWVASCCVWQCRCWFQTSSEGKLLSLSVEGKRWTRKRDDWQWRDFIHTQTCSDF